MSDNPYEPGIEANGRKMEKKGWSVIKAILTTLFLMGLIYGIGIQIVGDKAARPIDLLHTIIVISLVLWWEYADSLKRNIRMGSAIPILSILFQPAGVLVYSIHALHGKWYKMFLPYMGIGLGYIGWYMGISYVTFLIMNNAYNR